MEEALRLQTVGKYEMIASLGQGGMATVYLALMAGPAGFNKLLVLKILREEVLSGMEEGVNMFLDEARLSARMVHQNIVHTYEVGEHEGRYFIAMEYLEGQSYRAVQQRSRAIGGIPIHEELRVIADTARGLHYAHELKGYNGEPLGVVHRDVSPQNVFITYDGQVKLLDFGIAKTSDAEHLTQVGVIKGKLDYIAPEQLRGEQLDGRADVFALGAMLWEAVTGKRFSGGRKVADVTKVHVRIAGGEPNVRTVQPEVPEELARIIDRAIALKPEDRWPDAASFADAIEAYIESTGQKPSTKSLGAFVTPLFEEERQKMHKVIERQMDKVKLRGPTRIGEQTTSLPRLKLGDDSTSGLFVGGQDSVQVTLDGAPRSLAPLTRSSPVALRKARMRLVGISVLALAATAAAAVVLTRSPEAKPMAASSPPTAGEETAPAAIAPSANSAPAPLPTPTLKTTGPTHSLGTASLVALEIRVAPEGARVTLDGAPINVPFRGQFRRDAALHHVEVSAPGFRSQKQLVAFNEDRVLDVSLERVPDRPAPAPARRAQSNDKADKPVQAAVEAPAPKPEPTAPAPAPAAAPTGAPGEDLKTVRPRVTRGRIDSYDPYSQNK